ncbi:MAG: hypothetical protein HY875_07445 [Chloroflexi bacterium]|nr:hypothetical protein [Chloroflexota bacterium]
MAVFEFARPAVVAEAVRELRPSRHLPLYLAGIAAGAAIGLGLTFNAGSGRETVPVTAAPPVYQAPARPAAAAEAPASISLNVPATIPADLDQLFAAAALPAPAAPNAVPAAPAAAQPVSNTQPAPASAPASAPATQPAPQPAAQPAAQPEAPAAKSNFYLPSVSSGPATALESGLLAGLNAERVNAGLAPLAYDSGLTIVARTRSQQLVDQNYFAHVDPYGYSMYTELLARFGYGYAWAGENLALNNFDASESAQRAVIALMKSPSHRANILATDFSRVGIGEVTTADGRHYYTMIFLG